MQETWKPIKGYEGLYEISNLGRVKSLPKFYCNNSTLHKERFLKPQNKKGYYQVALLKNGKPKWISVHRLVAEAFIEKPPYLQINHKDGNKLNNRADNLEWCTGRENINHSIKIGLQKPKGHTNSNAKPIFMYDIDGNFICEYACCLYAHEDIGVPKNTLSAILNRKRKFWRGYTFKFKKEVISNANE